MPDRLWSTADLKLVALEMDAIFRGERDGHAIIAEAIRLDARTRQADARAHQADGRYRGSLQQLEVAQADLLALARLAPGGRQVVAAKPGRATRNQRGRRGLKRRWRKPNAAPRGELSR